MVGVDGKVGGSLNPEPEPSALRHRGELGDLERIGLDNGSKELIPEPDIGSGGEASLEEMILFELDRLQIMRDVGFRGLGLDQGHGLALGVSGKLEDGFSPIGVERFAPTQEVQDGAGAEAICLGFDVVGNRLTLIAQTELAGLDGALVAKDVFEGNSVETVFSSDEMSDDVSGISVGALLSTFGAAQGELSIGFTFESEPDDETASEEKVSGRAIPA
jgi:hypothetical protein